MGDGIVREIRRGDGRVSAAVRDEAARKGAEADAIAGVAFKSA
jgi:hypothetical protein